MYQIKIEEIVSGDDIVVTKEIGNFSVTEEGGTPGNRLVGGFLGEDPRVQVVIDERVESAFVEEAEVQSEPLDLSQRAGLVVMGYRDPCPSTSTSDQEVQSSQLEDGGDSGIQFRHPGVPTTPELLEWSNRPSSFKWEVTRYIHQRPSSVVTELNSPRSSPVLVIDEGEGSSMGPGSLEHLISEPTPGCSSEFPGNPTMNHPEVVVAPGNPGQSEESPVVPSRKRKAPRSDKGQPRKKKAVKSSPATNCLLRGLLAQPPVSPILLPLSRVYVFLGSRPVFRVPFRVTFQEGHGFVIPYSDPLVGALSPMTSEDA